MNLFSYHATGHDLSHGERATIEEKLQKLAHLWQGLADESSKVHVDVERADTSVTISVHLTIPRHAFHAEATGETLAEAVDDVEAKFRKQLEKLAESKAHDHHGSHRTVELDAAA